MFKIIFIIVTLIFFLISFAISYYEVNKKTYNTSYVGIIDYTKAHPELKNSIENFKKLQGELGCLDASSRNYKYISDYGFAKTGYCNANLLGNFDDAWQVISSSDSISEDNYLLKSKLKQTVTEENRVCLIHESERGECDYENIVKYTANYVFYLQVVLYTLIAGGIWIVFWLVLYYKGFLYIVYGGGGQEEMEGK